MNIEILDLAEADLQAGRDFYEARETGVGEYFLNSVFSDIDSLALFAGIHPMKFGFHRMLCARFPYAVYYSVSGGTISVWRVLDLRRDPSWITGQFD